ncbi:MAG: GNAT family N-acetyltransferase [Candidatus Dormibacterales bacterium]
MGAGDDARVAAAGHLFDGPSRPHAVSRFLADPSHHLLIAYLSGQPAGFVSGVEITHPDKGTEMLLYELAVDELHRRKGIGTRLVLALSALARERGCYGMWVLLDDDNRPAAATYSKAGGSLESKPLMYSWTFD